MECLKHLQEKKVSVWEAGTPREGIMVQLIITDTAWNKLSADQQAWIQEAADYASSVCREVSEAKEAEVLEQLKADGVTVIEVPDKTPWIEAVKDVVTANMNGQDAAYEQILAMK